VKLSAIAMSALLAAVFVIMMALIFLACSALSEGHLLRGLLFGFCFIFVLFAGATATASY